MKTLLVFVAAAIACSAALGATPAVAAGCASDYAFRAEAGRLIVPSFLATVTGAQSLEDQHVFDLLHREFAGQKAERLLDPLTPPCTKSAAFKDAVYRAAIIGISLHRVSVLIAAFPLKRAASRRQWRQVLATAVTGAAAEFRLATDIGSPKITVSQLAAQLVALRVQLKQ